MSFIAELKRRNVFRMAILYGVSSWLLLQVGDVLFGLLGVPDWSLRLLLAILLLGLPVALVFSWVYEMTPEGLKREREIDRSQSITGHTAKKLDVVVISLLGLALALFGADRFGFIPRQAVPAPVAPSVGADSTAAVAPGETAWSAPEERSIAVLPFVNLSSDPEQEYFSDGLAESLLHLLAQINDLRVAARTSSFHFKNHTGNITDIGHQLNVANVLEGSVRRAGDTVRVTAQLIKVEDGYHLWSGTYDRQMDDIFAIQDEIAGHVADALKLALLGEGADGGATTLPGGAAGISASRDTDNLQAYEHYLRGREQLLVGSYGSLPRAKTHFEQALVLDPDYELALIALGETYLTMSNTGQIPFAVLTEHMLEIGARIQEINADSAPALVMLAWARFNSDDLPDQALDMFRRAYERSPDDGFVTLQYGVFLNLVSDFASAITVLTEALELDPLSPQLHLRLGLAYARSHQMDKALFHGQRLQALEPKNPNAYGIQSRVYSETGRYVDAIEVNRQARILDPDDYELPAFTALSLLAIGQIDAAREEIRSARNIAKDGFLPQVVEAALHFRTGRIDDGGDLLLQLIAGGAEPRSVGVPLTLIMLRDYALASGQFQRVLEQIESWLRMDLATADLRGPFSPFVKMMMAPVIRASGNSHLANAIVDAIDASTLSDPRDLVILAAARQDAEQTVTAIESLFENHGMSNFSWLIMQSPVLAFVADDPRFKKLQQQLREHEAAQLALWVQKDQSTP